MNFTSKFDLGEDVYIVRVSTDTRRVPCTFCGGTGRIGGKDESDAACPRCYGKGIALGPQTLRHFVSGPHPVEMIILKITRAVAVEEKETYMLGGQEIECGVIWVPGSLYRTMAEARAIADAANQKENTE